MFAVLGAIVVVSLLGMVGLTLATKDQSLSGDLADIKSRDQVALSGLQLAVNRLVANPANMVSQINAYISSGRGSGTVSKGWLNFSGTNVAVQDQDPGWFYLNSATSTDQSAVKVKILAVSQGDTSAAPSLDSGAVFIELQGQGQGRHGDVRTVQGTYRIHGVTLSRSATSANIIIPKYAFYVGGALSSSNLQANITGDVYVGGSSGTYINSNTMTIHGNFKWNGDLKVNKALIIDSSAYIGGYLYINNDSMAVGQNLGIDSGLGNVNGPIITGGNMWIGGAQNAGSSWGSSGGLKVRGKLVFWPSGRLNVGGYIKVGLDAWLMSGLSLNTTDSVRTLGNFYVTDLSPLVTYNFNVTTGNLYSKGNFVAHNSSSSRTLTLPQNPGSLFRVTNQFYIDNGTIDLHGTTGNPNSGSTIIIDTTGYAYIPGSGNVTNWGHIQVGGTNYSSYPVFGNAFRPTSHANYVTAPTKADLGLDTSFQKTSTADNAMDSVKVDAVHSPTVLAHMVELTSDLISKACNATSSVDGSKMTPMSMNRIYSYLDSTKQTYNGYMILHITTSSPSTFFQHAADDSTTGFNGKAIYVIDASISSNNGNWPHSTDSTNIQILDIRGQNGGAVSNWGWKYGNFSGIFYWEDPPCSASGGNLALPSTGTWWGSLIIGTHKPASECTFSITPNSSSVTLIKSNYVFTSIATSLPGVMVSGVNADGTTSGVVTTITTITSTPLLRQTTDNPYFEAKGIYR